MKARASGGAWRRVRRLERTHWFFLPKSVLPKAAIHTVVEERNHKKVGVACVYLVLILIELAAFHDALMDALFG